jgi:hypothetical protein
MARRANPDPRQLALCFDAPISVAATEGVLKGLDRFVACIVSRIVQEDARPQAALARAVSSILGEEVSPSMLYAYAAKAKVTHNISVARLLALIVATKRPDAFDAIAQQVGCRVLEGAEFQLAQLGHVEAEINRLTALRRDLRATVQPFRGGAQ